MVNCLIFSYDRAMQLDAVLRSFMLHCHEAQQTQISVLYRTSSKKHTLQYDQLITKYTSQKNIRFIREDNFRRDVLCILNPFYSKPVTIWFLNIFIKRNGKIPRFFAKLLPMIDLDLQTLFLVDDNIFVRDFSLKKISNMLMDNTGVLGFSLRLGENTSFCYTLDVQQEIPKFRNLSENILMFDWTNSEADFGYPLEISSSVYRLRDIFPLIFSIAFTNPNSLEGHLAQKSKSFRIKYPQLLCFKNSSAFCIPVNKIQDENDNLFGINFNYSCEELAQKFNEGYRINVDAYSDFIPNACHQEVELKFKKYVN